MAIDKGGHEIVNGNGILRELNQNPLNQIHGRSEGIQKIGTWKR